MLKPDALSSSQHKFYDQLQSTELVWATKSGFQAETEAHELIGPFNAMLRSPEIATAMLGVTSAITKHATLSERVRQVIVLVVGATWQAAYEIYAHTAVARKAGLEEEAVRALANGQPPDGLSSEETLAHDFTQSLAVNHQVDSELYREAIETFGEQGVFDMIALAGQYMSISALLNAFAVPAPIAKEKSREQENPPNKPETPHIWTNTPLRTARRGNFWIPGDRVTLDGNTFQRGPMFVAWEAPERVTQPYPIILVHGGALQGTEWLDTPDGRPGWALRLVEAGYAVFVVDRPGQGRSPYHPNVVGAMGPPFAYEEGQHVFFPPEAADTQTQWPFDPDDDAALDAFIAPFGPLPADLAASQEMDADSLARLLDRIGPAIVITHSASGSDGWLAADRRPGLVVAIVTVEPMGPAFAETPGIGTLDWGLTAAPITYDPPCATADEVRATDPSSLRIPALAELPVAVVTGETSVQAKFAPAIVEFLTTAGAAAELLHLPDYGVFGNGHGLIYEKNSDQALQPVLRWLLAHTGNTRFGDTNETS